MRGVDQQLESAHREPPVNGGKELLLEDVELADSDATHFGIMSVCAERVAESL